MLVDGSQTLTEKDLEEFAEAARIDMSIYSCIELCEAGAAIGWAIYEYEHQNDPPYNLIEIFSNKKDMDNYIEKNLIGAI